MIVDIGELIRDGVACHYWLNGPRVEIRLDSARLTLRFRGLSLPRGAFSKLTRKILPQSAHRSDDSRDDAADCEEEAGKARLIWITRDDPSWDAMCAGLVVNLLADPDGTKSCGKDCTVRPARGDDGDESSAGNTGEAMPPLQVFTQVREHDPSTWRTLPDVHFPRAADNHKRRRRSA